MTTSEIQHRADFSAIRYAKCWEDAELLLQGLKSPAEAIAACMFETVGEA